jgi:molybdate transport system substrate-binding protein
VPRRRPSTLRLLSLLLALVLALVATGCGDDDGGEDTADEGSEAELLPPETTVAEGATESSAPAEGVEGNVVVFAAASLTDVFEELGTAFEAANPDATVELSFGPSSGLVTQITEGAPADVIATAATSNMDDLVEADALAGEPTDFATNLLELAVPPDNPGDVTGLDDLADPDLVVGLCAEEVPCGRFAREMLANADVEPSIDTNEEDVRALLTKVEAGEVDVGVVYRTDVQAAGDAVEGIEIADEDNVVATYPIATVADAANAEAAQAFIDFVLSDEGQAALADAGFEAP